MTKIIHFTTAHPRTDTRIRVKEVNTLAHYLDASVFLYVQDGLGDATDTKAGVQIVDTGRSPNGLVQRATIGAWRMLRAVLKARPVIAHFHDPELIPVGLMLRCFGVRVVYDVHENVRQDMLAKPYLSPSAAKGMALAATVIEWLAKHCFNAIVTATPSIAKNFEGGQCIVVTNFPKLEEWEGYDSSSIEYMERPKSVVYVGVITRIRGIREILTALSETPHLGASLLLAGSILPHPLENEIRALPGWQSTEYSTWVNRSEASHMFGRSRAGLVIFHPVPNHVEAIPNKLFEYMAVGLPVIVSDFPYWREILAGVDCAIFVDPLDPKAIGEAIQWIFDNPAEAEAMGKRGRQAVLEKFNWDSEGRKLVDLYTDILSRANIS